MNKQTLPVWSSSVPLRRGRVWVFEPIVRRARLHLSAPAGRYVSACLDDQGNRLLSQAMMATARYAGAVIYIPAGPWLPRECSRPSLHLVLCQRRLQLRRSAWKEMRAYHRRSAVRSLDLSQPSAHPRNTSVSHPPGHMEIRIEHETMFLCGSRDDYTEWASFLHAFLAGSPGSYYPPLQSSEHPKGGRRPLDEIWIRHRAGPNAWTPRAAEGTHVSRLPA